MITLTPVTKIEVSLVPESSGSLEIRSPDQSITVALAPFIKGDPGDAASISSDSGNHLTQGTDGGLFVAPPQLQTDHW